MGMVPGWVRFYLRYEIDFATFAHT
jgi:hypothetical protein